MIITFWSVSKTDETTGSLRKNIVVRLCHPDFARAAVTGLEVEQAKRLKHSLHLTIFESQKLKQNMNHIAWTGTLTAVRMFVWSMDTQNVGIPKTESLWWKEGGPFIMPHMLLIIWRFPIIYASLDHTDRGLWSLIRMEVHKVQTRLWTDHL